MGHAGQLCGAGMGHLLRDFPAFPALFARHEREHELRGADHGGGDLSCFGRLVYVWEEEVCVAA